MEQKKIMGTLKNYFSRFPQIKRCPPENFMDFLAGGID
jgi:hypothetical protein